MLIATHPRFVLVAMAYTYLASAFIGMAITRIQHRGGRGSRITVERGDVSSAPTPSRDSPSRRLARPIEPSGLCVHRSIVTVVPTPRSLSTAIVPPIQLHVPLGNRQAEPGAAGLRREVRLEDLRQRLLIHADAGVGDLDDHGRGSSRRRRRRRRPRSSASRRPASRAARSR